MDGGPLLKLLCSLAMFSFFLNGKLLKSDIESLARVLSKASSKDATPSSKYEMCGDASIFTIS